MHENETRLYHGLLVHAAAPPPLKKKVSYSTLRGATTPKVRNRSARQQLFSF